MLWQDNIIVIKPLWVVKENPFAGAAASATAVAVIVVVFLFLVNPNCALSTKYIYSTNRNKSIQALI